MTLGDNVPPDPYVTVSTSPLRLRYEQAVGGEQSPIRAREKLHIEAFPFEFFLNTGLPVGSAFEVNAIDLHYVLYIKNKPA
jgi:hypothetical protein